MRAFAAAWNGAPTIVQQPAGQLPWGHVMVLLDRFDNQHSREWYAAKAVQHGWSRSVLEHHIGTRLHLRSGAAPNNLEARLPGEGADLVREFA